MNAEGKSTALASEKKVKAGTEYEISCENSCKFEDQLQYLWFPRMTNTVNFSIYYVRIQTLTKEDGS